VATGRARKKWSGWSHDSTIQERILIRVTRAGNLAEHSTRALAHVRLPAFGLHSGLEKRLFMDMGNLKVSWLFGSLTVHNVVNGVSRGDGICSCEEPLGHCFFM
jgi:hypothetical protein